MVKKTKKVSVKCGIRHAFEITQVKMVCDIPHLFQFIPVQACKSNFKFSGTVSKF